MEARRPATPPPWSAGLIETLASMRFAIGLVCAIAVACVIATVIPQGPEVAEHLQNHPDASRWLKGCVAAGLTTIFSSWWFIGLLTTLGVSLAICITRRMKTLFTSGADTTNIAPTFGTLCVHVGILLTLAGGAIRLFWSERGMLQLREGEQTSLYITDDNREASLPYAVKLVKFEIERYQAGPKAEDAAEAERLIIQRPGQNGGEEFPVVVGTPWQIAPKASALSTHQAFQITILRRVPDFTMDTATRMVQSRSDKMLNPALLVRVAGNGSVTERWLFARYPDFDVTVRNGQGGPSMPFTMRYKVMVKVPAQARIKSFKSSVQIIQDAVVLKEKTIEVNSPLAYGGYSFYQASYNEEDLSWTGLLVVHDHSVPVVYLGFVFMGIGAFLTACWRAEKVKEESKC